MARFFQQDKFNIVMFCSIFSGVYKVYYDSGNYGEAYDNNVVEGDDLIHDPANAPLIKAFAEHQHDVPTSDRELAAFAVAYRIYERAMM